VRVSLRLIAAFSDELCSRVALLMCEVDAIEAAKEAAALAEALKTGQATAITVETAAKAGADAPVVATVHLGRVKPSFLR
jgi:hypothetical protein